MFSGPRIIQNGMLRAFDASSRRSTLRTTQSSNILPDPNNWTIGTGGQSGYSPNGSSSEQNRLVVTDDPWGRTSITWRTTPDSTSGADGGWNSSYYSIDNTFTYRFSVWVRRYTTGTGGTFYLGTNPAPIRNDNNSSQSNPYWHCPSIASLAYNQWYLVVAHCFHKDYTGGRHPESGYWYRDDDGSLVKTDLGFCNCGTQDVRWASGTGTTQHRTYHFYTTNTASGIEFAFPRVDKIDGTEPSIKELFNVGESGWVDIKNSAEANLINGVSHVNAGEASYFDLDGTDDFITLPDNMGYNSSVSVFTWFKSNGNPAGGYHIIFGGQQLEISVPTSGELRTGIFTGSRFVSNHGSGLMDGNWHFIGFTFSSITKTSYIDGLSVGTQTTSGTLVSSFSNRTMGKFGTSNSYYLNGQLSNCHFYNRALTPQEVQQNYNATKGRFI